MAKKSTPIKKPETQPQQKIDVRQISAQMYSGPLPLPEQLEQYENVLPGAADRIFKMAEYEQDARIKRFQKESKRKNRLSFYAFVIIISALAGGIFLSFEGKSVAGIVSLIGSLSALIGTYYYGNKRGEIKERDTLNDE